MQTSRCVQQVLNKAIKMEAVATVSAFNKMDNDDIDVSALIFII